VYGARVALEGPSIEHCKGRWEPDSRYFANRGRHHEPPLSRSASSKALRPTSIKGDMRARAVRFAAVREVDIVQVDVRPPQEGEILVRTLFSGISAGTELLAYRGLLPPSLPLDEELGSLMGGFTYPFHYGYSCVGRIEESKSGLQPGALVFAFHPHQELFVAVASDVVPLDGVDPRIATLYPHLETALQVSLDAGPVRYEPVVVMGLGAVGMLIAALLRRAGADVIGTDPSSWRRGLGDGFEIASAAPADIDDVVKERTEGRGVPLVVEASGNPRALPDALGLLSHEGTALVVSWYGAGPVSLPLGGDFHRRRLCIRSTQVSSIPSHLSGRWTINRRRSVAASLFDELSLGRLATHEFAVDDAAEAFEALDHGEDGLVHAALRYRQR
jgi:2-desacetyl-2-hydroxyethyl bacteriochlorophyllide A dehydrogenase